MFPIGIPVAVDAFLSSGFRIWFLVAMVALILLISAITPAAEKDDTPVTLSGCSLLNVLRFFGRRFDFLNAGFCSTGENVFQFKLLQNTVIAVSGESARTAFFTAKGLNLTEGFKVLSGALPMLPGITSDLQMRRITLIHKRLAAVQKSPSLSRQIPSILADCHDTMMAWGASGTFDPFEKVYELLFQTTVRTLSCSEIADDSALVARLKHLYDQLDSGTTPATILLPWLPSYGMVKKLRATKGIYEIVQSAINAREQSGISRDDTLQMLLDCGDERLAIIGFIMGLLIAGARATGTSASWLMTFLGYHADWRSKAKTEIETLLHARPPLDLVNTAHTLSARLAQIPLDIWETQTPILDSLIRETLRLAQPHAAMRRNLGKEVSIGGKTIPTGTYVVYPFSDVHLDPSLYPDPWKFDPAREFPSKASFGYVGWGGGHTVCLGTRLAKLELKLVTAMFILGFEHTLVDRTGMVPDSPPRPNWNDTLLCRPANGPCYLKYERSDLAL